MQNKGLVRLFAILFGIVSIYQLSFTFITNKIEDEATVFANNEIADTEDDYVAKRKSAEVRYLDSIGNTEVLNLGVASFTYNEAKEKELKRWYKRNSSNICKRYSQRIGQQYQRSGIQYSTHQCRYRIKK